MDEDIEMTTQRPVLAISRSPQSRVLNGLAIAGLVATLAITWHAWSALPDQIAVHYGVDGRPNGWGSKGTLWAMPILGIVTYGVFTVLGRYPHSFNYAVPITEQNASQQYQIACHLLNWLKAEFAWLLFYIVWFMSKTASGNQGFGIWFLPVMMCMIFGTVGFWLRRSYLAR
jgi:uncharacterized membrane protein